MPADESGYRIWILQVKKKLLAVPHQSGKFPLSGKFRVDNSVCHAITVTKKGLTTSNFFYISVSVFWPEKFKTNVHFRRPWLENLDNQKN